MMKRISIYVLVATLVLCLFSVSAFADDELPEGRSDSSERISSEVKTEVLRISASDTNGLHAIVLSLLGDYNPIVKDYTYTTTSYNGSTQTNHSIEITPDWSWICTAALFIVVVWCTFKFIGGIFSK